jgi:hypothetical protein
MLSGIFWYLLKFIRKTKAPKKMTVFWDDRPDDGGSKHL